MKIKNPMIKWLISVTELALVFLVVFLGVKVAQNLPAPQNFGDYVLICLGVVLTLLVAGYLAMLWLADFPPLENSLINQVYIPEVDGKLTPVKQLAQWVGSVVREDRRLLRYARRAAEKPENLEFMSEVLERVEQLRSRREREVLLRYSLSTLEARRKAFRQAKKDAERLAREKPPKPPKPPKQPKVATTARPNPESPVKTTPAARPRSSRLPPALEEPRRGGMTEGESPKRKPGLRLKR